MLSAARLSRAALLLLVATALRLEPVSGAQSSTTPGSSAATTTTTGDEEHRCSDACADFDKVMQSCSPYGRGMTGPAYWWFCSESAFQALIKCGKCQPELYEPYSGAMKGFVENALAQCSANGFTLNVDTSHLPNESNTTFTTNSTSTENFNLTQITQLAECTSECTSVCSLEDAINFNSTCICTKEYLASQYDCAACAMKVTDTDWQTTLVTEEARVLVDQCARVGISGLSFPTAIIALASPPDATLLTATRSSKKPTGTSTSGSGGRVRNKLDDSPNSAATGNGGSDSVTLGGTSTLHDIDTSAQASPSTTASSSISFGLSRQSVMGAGSRRIAGEITNLLVALAAPLTLFSALQSFI